MRSEIVDLLFTFVERTKEDCVKLLCKRLTQCIFLSSILFNIVHDVWDEKLGLLLQPDCSDLRQNTHIFVLIMVVFFTLVMLLFFIILSFMWTVEWVLCCYYEQRFVWAFNYTRGTKAERQGLTISFAGTYD